MVEKRVTIKNPTGLHLRPTGILCNTAVKYESRVLIEHDGVTANAKSLLNVLATGIKRGDEILLICDGVDEEEAMEAMIDAIENKLE